MRTTIAATLLVLLTCASLAGDAMKAEDRQRLIAHFEMTESWLLSELDALSPAQLKFRMTPESWTIMDVVEHLAIAEPQYLAAGAGLVEATAHDDQDGDDRRRHPLVRDRSDEPGADRRGARSQGRWDNIRESLGEFRKLRATMLQTARTTQDDLRSRRLVGGNMDVYQWFLMISTHSQRHILQIREIKAHSGYPRK